MSQSEAKTSTHVYESSCAATSLSVLWLFCSTKFRKYFENSMQFENLMCKRDLTALCGFSDYLCFSWSQKKDLEDDIENGKNMCQL